MNDTELLQAQLIQCTKAMGRAIAKLRDLASNRNGSSTAHELECVALDLYAARGDAVNEASEAAVLLRAAEKAGELQEQMNLMQNQLSHAEAAEGAYGAMRDRLAERTAQRDALATRVAELENARHTAAATQSDDDEEEEGTSEVEELRQEVSDLDEENTALRESVNKFRDSASFWERAHAEVLLTVQEKVNQAMAAERAGIKEYIRELKENLAEARHFHKDIVAEEKLKEVEAENELLRERLGSQEISSEKDFAAQEAKWEGYYKEDARSMLRTTAAVVARTEEELAQLARIPGLEEEIKRLQAWAEERERLFQKIEGLAFRRNELESTIMELRADKEALTEQFQHVRQEVREEFFRELEKTVSVQVAEERLQLQEAMAEVKRLTAINQSFKQQITG